MTSWIEEDKIMYNIVARVVGRSVLTLHTYVMSSICSGNSLKCITNCEQLAL